MRCRRLARVAAGALIAIGAPACAAADAAGLLRQVEAAQRNAETQAAVLARGREAAGFCAYCHGADGNSVKAGIPNLAAQNPAYLLDQIEKFAAGTRKDFTTVMQQLARRFTEEEKIALAVYYAAAELRPVAHDAGAARRGAPLYAERCRTCHGADGRGQQGFARVAGQDAEYLRTTLRNFRDGASGHVSPVMAATTKGLGDAEIGALADYLAGLR